MTRYDHEYRLPEPEAEQQRKSAVGRVIGWLLGWGIIGGGLAAAAGSILWLAFTAAGPLSQNSVVDIQKGLNRSQIAAFLEDEGAISDARLFSAAAAAESVLRGRFIKPGEYQFNTGSSMREVLATVLAGRVITYKLTIPEGFTSEMAVARLRENDVLAGDIAVVPPEGTLLANTFVFTRGTPRAELLAEMQAAQSKLVDEVWAKRSADTPLKSQDELLTLASIVEKETGKPEERSLVAAVFLNRLKQGIKLQSDPTIIYGLVGGKGKLDRALTRADIDGATPYNTYTIAGMPPGPIATPGRAALEAVINPAKVEYLYFVADGSGGHAFATTLDEHNKNVAQWRKIENAPEPEPVTETKTDAGDVLAAVPLEPETAATPQPSQPVAEPLPAEAVETATDTQVAQVQALADSEPVLDLKPGSIIRVGQKLIPVPAQKKPK